jgi:hypothetical protein
VNRRLPPLCTICSKAVAILPSKGSIPAGPPIGAAEPVATPAGPPIGAAEPVATPAGPPIAPDESIAPDAPIAPAGAPGKPGEAPGEAPGAEPFAPIALELPARAPLAFCFATAPCLSVAVFMAGFWPGVVDLSTGFRPALPFLRFVVVNGRGGGFSGGGFSGGGGGALVPTGRGGGCGDLAPGGARSEEIGGGITT